MICLNATLAFLRGRATTFVRRGRSEKNKEKREGGCEEYTPDKGLGHPRAWWVSVTVGAAGDVTPRPSATQVQPRRAVAATQPAAEANNLPAASTTRASHIASSTTTTTAPPPPPPPTLAL